MKKLTPIKEVVDVNPAIPKSLLPQNNRLVSFVPMAGVSEDGYLKEIGKRKLSEVVKGFNYFEKGDVLLAKITPCFEA